MKNVLKVGLVAGALILFGAGCAKSYGTNSYSTPTVSLPEQPASGVTITPPAPAEAKVEYTEAGFNPSTLRVLVGTKVTFVNKSAKDMWVASDPHPSHTICPGFDAMKGYKKGESFSYTFPKSAECPFHNHLSPRDKGSIEVKPAEQGAQ